MIQHQSRQYLWLDQLSGHQLQCCIGGHHVYHHKPYGIGSSYNQQETCYLFLDQGISFTQTAVSFPWLQIPSSCCSHCTDRLKQPERGLLEPYIQISIVVLVIRRKHVLIDHSLYFHLILSQMIEAFPTRSI
jgi:hypothetical protein